MLSDPRTVTLLGAALLAAPALAAEVCGVGSGGAAICMDQDENGHVIRAYAAGPEALKKMALGSSETRRLTPEEEAQSLKLFVEQVSALTEDNARCSAERVKLWQENARLSAELERVRPQPGLCSNITKLQRGITKKQVAKLFGEPEYSRMSTCGGAPGVKRWQCETLRYPCRREGYTSNVSLTFSGNFLNDWE